ncbi:MAG: hypothetical protein OXF86_05280 [Caldilineaceae bacterium]|nr:hypothetical protein [Caldilineaceae bacterium]
MAEDRMDRFERNLDRYAEESNQRMTRLECYAEKSNQRMTHLEQFLANFSRDVARNTLESSIRIRTAQDTLDQLAELLTRTYKQTNEYMDQTAKQANERMDRTDKEIAQLSHEIEFLLAAIQGHSSQPIPPAHQE